MAVLQTRDQLRASQPEAHLPPAMVGDVNTLFRDLELAQQNDLNLSRRSF